MWESILVFPRGSLSTRSFVLFFASVIVALFASLLVNGTPVSAATDATWQQDNLSYDGDTYEPLNNPPAALVKELQNATIYQNKANSKDNNFQLIYFPSGTTPKNEKEATYVRYTLNPPNDLSNPRDKKTITVTPVDSLDGADTSEGSVTCSIDGIGWIACPLMKGIAEGMDFIYKAVSGFLVVQPITTSVDNPIYRVWVYSRDLANVAFIIGFIVIIYSYLVGGGFNGYEVRKILPRLVIAAILINVSYFICAIAVDISNIAGYGINQLFEGIRDDVLPGSMNDEINWVSVTTFVVGGGVGTIAGVAGLAAATGGAAGGLWFLLAPFLVGAALLVIVTFLILAARQAIIVIFIAIAPLAFAAFILPNTEKWFEKWRSVFFTMLIMFPAFGAVFGGAQLAGQLIIRTASSIEQIILGLGVMVAPLAITPLLLRLGGGVLNRFGGIINNTEKGIFDRFKNYNNDRRQDFLAKQNARNAELRQTDGFKRRQFARKSAARSFAKRNFRETKRKEDEAKAHNYWHADTDRWGGDNSSAPREGLRYFGRSEGYGNLEEYKRRNAAFHDEHEAHHDRHWNERFDIQSSHFDQGLFDQRVRTMADKDKASLADNRLENAYTEMKAGRNPYNAALGTQGPATANLQRQINDVEQTALNISLEGLKKQNAEVTIQGNTANVLKENEALRKYAGGVAGADGANRVYAKAKKDIVSAYLEDVENSRSVLSEYSLSELVQLHQTGRDRSGSDMSGNNALRDAAMREIVLAKGNNWSFQKTKDYVSSMGMVYNEADNTYHEVIRDSNGFVQKDANNEPIMGAQITDQTEIDRRRDVQQLFVDSAKNSKLKIANFSGTDRGNAEVGTFFLDSQEAIIRDMRDKKINASRLASTDVDELQRMIQVLRSDDARGRLDSSSRASMVKTIEFALTDPQVRASIGDREAELMQVISNYVGDDRERIPDETKLAYETYAKTKAPRVYRTDRVSDYGDGKGPDGSL